MTVASGILKTLAWKKQTGLGSPASGSGGTAGRRVTSLFTAPRDTFESNEIVAHHQSTGVTYGLHNASGSINGELSAGSYDELIASLLEQDMTAGINSTALSVTYGGTAGAWTAARASGSFLTDGFKIGDIIRASGGSEAANNARNFLITNVVALTITFIALDGAAVTAGASTTTTLTVTGKKSFVPSTAHEKDYYTVEEFYSDISKSETFEDCRMASLAVNLPATGNATVSMEMIGLSRELGNAQVLTSPTSSTTAIMNATNGRILVGGSVQTVATSITINVANGAANAGAVIGSNYGADVTTGRIRVSGTLTAQFDSTTLQALYDGETTTDISIVLLADGTAASDFVAFSIPRVKLTGDAPDDGEKVIIRTYPFTAEYNATGGTGVSREQTIISYQDSAA
jgi:hypothetical protein